MALGRRQPKQGAMWVSSRGLAESPGHRFYEKLNELLAKHAFDEKTEALCAPFYEAAGTAGRPSIPPGVYFRMLLVGYFEGLESERGICWRCADSLSLRGFLGLGLTDAVPDQSTLSRTRKRLPEELFKQVFGLVLEMVAASGLLKGKVVGVDSTYLRADASMKSIVRRDTGESYADYIRRLAKEDGAVEPTVEDARRLDRSRAKTTSNEDWQSATDEDARIARLKDGRTRLAYKAEHVVDMDSGVIIDATVHPADKADAATIVEAAERARDVIDKDDDPPAPPTAASILPAGPVIEIVADKGYHKASVLRELKERGFRTFIPERKQRGNRRWTDKGGLLTADAFHQNRARVLRAKGKALQRRRGEMLERPFAHLCESGGMRRVRLRGTSNVAKRYQIQAMAANLAILMRKTFGFGTPRGLAAVFLTLISNLCDIMGHTFHRIGAELHAVRRAFGPFNRSRSYALVV